MHIPLVWKNFLQGWKQWKILKNEKSGVLAWLLRGYLDWKKNGLNLPQSILDDKASYYQDEDVIGQFIAQYCDTSDDKAEIQARELHRWFRDYCNTYDIDNKYSQKSFPAAIEKHGFRRERDSRRGYYFVGIDKVI